MQTPSARSQVLPCTHKPLTSKSCVRSSVGVHQLLQMGITNITTPGLDQSSIFFLYNAVHISYITYKSEILCLTKIKSSKEISQIAVTCERMTPK